MTEQVSMEKIIALCKRRGFVFPGSEIYGGLANSWDYGPLGSQLAKNLKDLWWKTFVEGRLDMVGIDSAVLMNPTVWEASGHVAGFSDPLMDCKKCKSRERADKLVEKWVHENSSEERPKNWAGEKTPPKDLLTFITEKKIICPICEACDWTEPKAFNLMFKTRQGVLEDSGKDIYLRPETAQGIFVNFKNALETSRKKLPFGIGQIGKAFRNEITPGNFIFRTREFEQMEIEYFFDPEQTEWKSLLEKWKADGMDFMANKLGISQDHLRFRDHDPDELSHYSKGTTDIEFNFPFGWAELAAAGAYRTDFDLKQHEKFSGQKLTYLDPYTNKVFTPHVMEPSYGVGRLTLAILISAYHEEKIEGEEESRVVMKFKPQLAPVTVAVLPLGNKLNEAAHQLATDLIKDFRLDYDTSGSIGKRYRRQDEIGTPFCITYDFESLEDQSVTVRHRDTMEQERVKISDLKEYLNSKLF
ncbi:glycine--tRNA ligase [Candidatus Peregrinibacteria bacterium]|nr:glycine--tRNA ligase [Candidatus Peregrinibacteria bacterium]